MSAHRGRNVGGRAALLLFATTAAAAVGVGSSCGGPVCGNGNVEEGEGCDDGNTRDDDGCSNSCDARETLDATIAWTIVGREYPPFSETCGGVLASNVRIEITGPMTITETVGCGNSQYLFTALRPGSYVVRATLLDINDLPITNGLASVPFGIADRDIAVPIDFAFADFTSSYTGNFFFRVSWAGSDSCAGASPPVASHVLNFERDGAPITCQNPPCVTDEGDPVDGSAPGVCRDSGAEFPQTVNRVPWGPVTVTVTGSDGAGTVTHRETFATFIGGGLSNPDLLLDVNSLAPDAGPAPIDAGPPSDASTGTGP